MWDKKYFAAGMDIAGFAAGCAADIGIGLAGTFLVGTVGIPTAVVAAIGFGTSVLASVVIDAVTSKAKDSHYGGV